MEINIPYISRELYLWKTLIFNELLCSQIRQEINTRTTNKNTDIQNTYNKFENIIKITAKLQS